jgi:hypothetical protein
MDGEACARFWLKSPVGEVSDVERADEVWVIVGDLSAWRANIFAVRLLLLASMGCLVLNVSGLVADDSICAVQGALRDTLGRAVVGFACGVSDVLAGKLEPEPAFKASDSTMEFPDNKVCEISIGWLSLVASLTALVPVLEGIEGV